MSSRFVPFARLRPLCAVAIATATLVAPLTPARAAGSKQLQHVRGTIGYQAPDPGAAFQTVFGKFDLPECGSRGEAGAVAAVLAMPDSSLIALGENTSVQPARSIRARPVRVRPSP